MNCKTIKESLEARYSLAGLDEFLELKQTTSTISYINITPIDSEEEIANIVLLITPYYLELGMLERISENLEDKGVVRKVIQLVICKAVDLDLPIHFHASPQVGKNIKHVSQNKTRLYKYYNSLGFTRVNESGDDIYYETSVEKLKNIIKRNASNTRKTRKTRKAKTRNP